ncbi:MAG TPA: MFS transporter [Gemmataceae bacterium]|nr:MFS transporter [Gemmataceae bacterium]
MGSASPILSRGRWMALAAALLGWMFDGFEMGLFPVISQPALTDLLQVKADPQTGQLSTHDKALVAQWNGLAVAGFLIGAATGGVIFGWLGDRLGRVRAMALSIVTYALCSGLGAFTSHPWQIVLIRFLAALGMGGEWSLGVALVMEVWSGKSRGFLAGLIGAAANLGYATVAVLSMGLERIQVALAHVLTDGGMTSEWVHRLTDHSAWRLLMVAGTIPALLTFFIFLCVPESHRWQEERRKGSTAGWMTKDLLGVLIGLGGGIGLIALWNPMWSEGLPWWQLLIGTLVAVAIVTLGYLYPMLGYLRRSAVEPGFARLTLNRMLLGAALSGVALLGTWGSIQWAPNWADALSKTAHAPEWWRYAKQWATFWSAWGAIAASLIAPIIGYWMGRRIMYALLCLLAMAASWLFYQGNVTFGTWFLVCVFLAGGATASFYGWLPLYLPELFPTRVRATGQGFSFNFGRILAAIGALQTGNLTAFFSKKVDLSQSVPSFIQNPRGLPMACTFLCLIYVLGVVLAFFAPETKGKPLPD